MRTLCISALIAALFGFQGASLAAADTPPALATTPESAIQLPVAVLRGNDFKAFYVQLPAEYKAKAEADWKKAQDEAKSGSNAKQAGEMNEMLAKFLAPDAVDKIVKENEPKLAEMNPQEWSQNLQMAAGFLPMLLGQPQPGQTPEQAKTKQALAGMLQGILTDASSWLLTAGINDPKKLRSAVEHLVTGAKALGVKDVTELQKLGFEDFLGRLGPIVKEAKGAAGVYDIQIDGFLDSIKAVATAPVPGASPDERTLDVSFSAFGKPYTFPVNVMRKNGSWTVSPKNAEPFGAMKQMMPGAGGAP